MTPWRALALVLACSAGAAHAQSRMYCCNDSSGQRICGDTLPQVCYDRTYRELTPGGRVVREVELLTPAQRTQREAALKAQRERAAREAEAKRRDQVLLDSYASVSEIDRRRDREISGIEADLKRARSRETELLALKARQEKAKPSAGTTAKAIADELGTITGELDAIRSVIDAKQREIDQTRSRFDADRQRYLELVQNADLPGTSAGR